MAPHSCMENPMDGGAWWAAVHGVAKSRTQLSNFTFTFHFYALEKEMATHSSVLAWKSQGRGSLVGCHLWGRTESDTTEATQQQQQQILQYFRGGTIVVQNLPCNARDRRYPGVGTDNPPQYSCLEFHGKRSLTGYRPWGRRESDMTEHNSKHKVLQVFQK